jgi:hypothetical protein
VAGLVYGIFSLVFLWMTTNAVILYDTFPELFGNDALLIIGMLFIATVIWYILFVIIYGYYVPAKYKKVFNILFILFSSVYVIVPLCSRPELFLSVLAHSKDLFYSFISSVS